MNIGDGALIVFGGEHRGQFRAILLVACSAKSLDQLNGPRTHYAASPVTTSDPMSFLATLKKIYFPPPFCHAIGIAQTKSGWSL